MTWIQRQIDTFGGPEGRKVILFSSVMCKTTVNLLVFITERTTLNGDNRTHDIRSVM